MIRRLILVVSFITGIVAALSGATYAHAGVTPNACTGSSSANSGNFCSSTGALTVTTFLGPNNNQWANHWPSTDTVSGLAGSLSGISVNLYDWTAFQPYDDAVMLQAPGGQAIEIFAPYNCGDGSVSASGVLNIADTGQANLFSKASCAGLSGSWKPSVDNTHPKDVFPQTVSAPGTPNPTATGSITFTAPAPEGTGTLSNVFSNLNGSGLNGTWKLYVESISANDCSPSCTSMSLGSATDSSWGLAITTSSAADNTATTLSSPGPSTAFTSSPGSSVSFTATVTDTSNGGTAVNAGSVTFYEDGASLGSFLVNGSGQATNPIVFSTEGTHAITAVYNGSSGAFFPSQPSNAINETVYSHTSISGSSYCNNGAITVPATGATGPPYASNPNPSNVFVGNAVDPTSTGLTGVIQNLTVSLNSMTIKDPQFLGLMLVSASGTAYDMLSSAGGSSQWSAKNFVLSDAGASPLPENSNPPPGTYQPASYADTGTPNTWPSPAPGSFDSAAPRGSATLLTEFAGAGANGTWQLFAALHGSSDLGGTIGSWCLNFTMATNVAATTTTVQSTNNPSTTGANVTFTATVTSNSVVNAGTVAFKSDGNTLCASQAVANGQAQCSTSSLAEGTHSIQAVYSGTANLGVSNGKVSQEVNNATVETVNGNTYTYCNPNPAGVSIPNPAHNSGAAAPYPENIFVTHLPGTINHLTVSINGFTTDDPQTFQSLLVGPQGGSQNIDFFSNMSSLTPINSPSNLVFDDSAASVVHSPTSGTYQPTSTGGNDAFASPAPAVANYAASHGTATFGSVFGAGSSNTTLGGGKWSFYFNTSIADANEIAGKICLNFTENPPVFTVTKTHTDRFVQGATGKFTVKVKNTGPGPSGGTTTATDTFPAGMTLSSFSGTDWSCTGTTTATCTNSDDVAQGTNFPDLTITAAVGNLATPGDFNNHVAVTGGGTTGTATADDPTTIFPAPVFSVQKSHTGNFTYYRNGTYSIIVSNTATNSQTAGTTTVTDSLPTGMSLVSYTGTDWTCTGTTSVSCTNADVITGGNAFPTIALTVSLDATAVTGAGNQARASGGGALATATSNLDSTTIDDGPTTTAVVSDIDPSVYGQSVTYTATVTLNNSDVGPVTPTGSVSFYADGDQNTGTQIGGAVTLDGSGQAAISDASLTPAGSPHTITAVYSPNPTFASSSAVVAGGQGVNAAGTSISTATSGSPSTYGGLVTFTATITVNAPGSTVNGPPTGTVDFFDNGSPLGTGGVTTDINGNTTASTDVSYLTGGDHTITSRYNGDGNFSASTDNTGVNQHVDRHSSTTKIQLTSGTNPSNFNDPLTFTATVTGFGTPSPAKYDHRGRIHSRPSNILPGPTGTVRFYDGDPSSGGTQIGTDQTLDGSGQAQISTSSLSAGSHTIFAVYEGNTNFSGSQDSISQDVQLTTVGTTTSVSLTGGTNPSTYGDQLTFTATITPTSSSANTITGSVEFWDGDPTAGGIDMGGQAVSGGQAQFITTALSATGTPHDIFAVYSGDPNFDPSQGDVTQTINPATLTVTADSLTRGYGSPVPSIGFTLGGAVNGDDTSSLDAQISCGTSAPSAGGKLNAVGSFDTTCVGPASFENYTVDYVPGTLTVTPATLTFTAKSYTITYDAMPPMTIGFKVTGYVNGDTAKTAYTGMPKCKIVGYQQGTVLHAGSYVTRCNLSGVKSSAYALAAQDGKLLDKKQYLVIQPHAFYQIHYGTSLPHLSDPANWSIYVFRNGDSLSSLTTMPTCAPVLDITDSHGKVNVPTGVYQWTCHGAVARDYRFQYNRGNLHIIGATAHSHYVGPHSVSHKSASKLKLKARLKSASTSGQTGGQAIAGAKLVIGLAGGPTCVAHTNSKGIGKCAVAMPANGNYTINLAFAGDQYYKATSAEASLRITK